MEAMREDLMILKQRVLATIPRAIETAAASVRKHIITRTGSGVDIDGKPFVRYKDNPRVPRRQRYYVKHKSGQRTPVTLVKTGDMLSSIRIDKIPGGRSVVLPRRETRKGRILFTGTSKGLPARRWWGVSPGFRGSLGRNFGRQLLDIQTPTDRRRNFKIGVTGAGL